jgi:hypothetical protein
MEHRGFHLFISPLVVFCFVVMAPAPPYQVGEQGLCQGHNKLIFLAFSVFQRARADPHRTKLDSVIVPGRNTLKTTTTNSEEFGFLII